MTREIIDMQAHFMPESYISLMKSRDEIPHARKDGKKYFFRYGETSAYMITPFFYDISMVLENMDDSGISMQVLSINIPGAEVGESEHDLSVEVAQKANDDYAAIVQKYPDRFSAFATLPLSDTEAALKEARRAVEELGFTGLMIFSNVYGMSLSDKRLWPLYEYMQEKDIPMYIHPTKPLIAPHVAEYGLEPMLGYLYDTSLAAMKMILSGIFTAYPDLKVILPHAGGVLPYLAARLDHQAKLNPQAMENISLPPSEYIKKLYLDTVCLSASTLQLALDLVGADHILFATDYPFVPADISIRVVENLSVSDEDKKKIFSGNARKLLKLKS